MLPNVLLNGVCANAVLPNVFVNGVWANAVLPNVFVNGVLPNGVLPNVLLNGVCANAVLLNGVLPKLSWNVLPNGTSVCPPGILTWSQIGNPSAGHSGGQQK